MPEINNRIRAAWAMAAIKEFTNRAGGADNGLPCNIKDLLCNLRHLCRQRKISWETVLEEAEPHFAEEIGLYWMGPVDDLSEMPHCSFCANRTPYTYIGDPYCLKCYQRKKPWKSSRSRSKTSGPTRNTSSRSRRSRS